MTYEVIQILGRDFMLDKFIIVFAILLVKQMKKQLLIGIAAVLVLGGGYFFYSQSSGKPANNNQPISGMVKGTLQDLFARETSMQCKFSYDDEGNKSEGTVYLSGKKMRGDFALSQSDGKSMQSHVIRDDVYGYTWLEGQKQGTKIKIETSEKITKDQEGEKDGELFALDNKDVDYDCKAWNVDNSMLKPPANINFQDISAQVEQIQENTQQVNESKCATCNQAPAGTAKEQCLEALNCN